MKNTLKLIPLAALCVFAAFESSITLADDAAALACPSANEYIQIYNLPINLPMHTVYDVKYKGNFSETLKIKSDSGWLLTITNIIPDLNTPVKTIGDIAKAMDTTENDTVMSLQDSQNKVAYQTTAKWEGKAINVWECKYPVNNHPASSAYAILPRG